MGIVTSFTAVTPERLARLKEVEEDHERLRELVREIEADPVLDGDRELTCDLDKSDEGLSYLLRAAGVEVYLELYHKEVIGSQTDWMLAGWPPEEVQTSAELLKATPFERLAEHYDSERMARNSISWRPDPDDHDAELAYLRANYDGLVRFLDAAARTGLAAIQVMR